MPKVGSSRADLLRKWIRVSKHLTTDGKVVFCNACSKQVTSNQKYQIDQHLSTQLHRESEKKSFGKLHQAFISTLASNSQQAGELGNEFFFDLCNTMAQSNIPWYKLEQPAFRTFLEKYCNRHIPNESTLRKNYLRKCYHERLNTIKEKIGNNSIYFVVDETTDACGRYIANILVGVLSDTEPPVSYLLHTAALEKTNHSTIARFVNDSLVLLYSPNPVKSENIKLMLSDAAAYMLKAGQALQIFYPNLIQFTCMAHALNILAELVRLEYPAVNNLINNGKKAFLKAPLRVQHYREIAPDLPLPPEPIITRWVAIANIGNVYPMEFVLSSLVEGQPRGHFSGPKLLDSTCQPHSFRGLLDSADSLQLNWSYTGNKDFEGKTNVTFELKYRKMEEDALIHRTSFVKLMIKECHLWLRPEESSVSWKDFPRTSDCQTWFPGHDERRGLVVELVRLNVPCARGYLHFSGLNTSQHQFVKSHKQARLCGKLEELSDSDRHIYFPSSHTPPFLHFHGIPMFAFSYRLVDYCYNMTFLAKNGSFELKPTGELECTFKINLPYGNRVALTLQIGDSTSTGVPDTSVNFQEHKSGDVKCEGLLTQLLDGESSWWHCTRPGDAERQIQILSRGNKVVLRVSVRSSSGSALGLRMLYKAEAVEDIVGRCGFGWVALRQFCVAALEASKLPWAQAEMECTRKGGHLISIRNEYAQNVVDNLLLNSPGYRDHNAYWIGASDKTLEGDFRWADGLPFSYTNWFPGWSQHGNYNRQPNDDGLSEQDCVEVRRVYSLPTSPARLANTFMWNDRDCAAPNYFICERLQSDEPLEDNWPPDCNRSVVLSRQQPRTSVASPSFPRPYPDNVFCETEVSSPPGYRLVLDFEELVLESEPACSYDYLEILENFSNSSSSNESGPGRRLCGDWSSKLKLLRYVSKGSKLRLRFSSDYSHHFGGFKARVSMENVMQCSDDRLQMFNNSCYLFVSYPEVTWSTAQQICLGIKAQLTSVLSPEEETFISTNIRRSPEYRTSALYWFGARSESNGKFYWVDGNPMTYSGWLPNNNPEESNAVNNPLCLGVQWMPAPIPVLPSGLYWKPLKCDAVGGYVCKRPNHVLGLGINFNKTVNGSEGHLTTPNYPGYYYNNLDFSVKIVGPERTRLVMHFEKLDLEPQVECLYDYVQLKSTGKQSSDGVKWCGNYDTDMQRFDFVSEGNEAELLFHSDYSISGSGLLLHWQAVDVSECPMQTLTAREGVLTSPNYPNFLLPRLDCSITILAPNGRRVWLEFQEFNVGNSLTSGNQASSENSDDRAELLQIELGNQSPAFRPFEMYSLITEGAFISDSERLQVTLKTGDRPIGKGFKAIYKTISVVDEERVVNLENNTIGSLLHLNYPDEPSSNVNFVQHFVAPLGHIISLELYHVKFSEKECADGRGIIEIYDNYADSNGTQWSLCYDKENENSLVPQAPIAISSYLNTIHVRQKSGDVGIPFNGSLRIKHDANYKLKLLKLKEGNVEFCTPNPCMHGGKCVLNGNKQVCQCQGHFTGIFCALSYCELEPCVFGRCELTPTSYKCHCKAGYVGPNCDQKQKPCEGNPCESRGVCTEKGNGYHCRCHAWWEGPRCERRMMRIPYKPLSERMLEEPFWLGLITVTVVMGVIGLVWCAKRHFPEKIEKLLAEESDRNRSNLPSLRTSLRDQLAASGASAVTVTPSPGPGVPRSLFGRLGIRKPSILSLTSPHASGYSPATARTFSLDDLLKPPRRTPSPRKKRNNSTPTKKNAAEKKQILQQLVTPGNKNSSRKVSLGELIQLSERKIKDGDQKPGGSQQVKETKLSVDSPSIVLNDPKLEKKVTFARLLNKVSAEMSSGSEMELGIMQANRLGCAFARPSSTPPSPAADARSPNSTSSNQGSDTFSSSDLAIPSTFSCSISDLMSNRKHARLPNGRQKPASADSILAMFRNFSSSSAGINLPSSLKVSPSTTPTASSPQDDVAGDDESSTSSIHTPISFSSGPPESPIMHRQSQGTIEVPVLDMLSAHKSSSSGSNLLHPPTILLEIPSTINKCLSPIREMPTPLPSPMPSPAITPIMHRSTASSSINDISIDMSDDRISFELPNISISDEDELQCTQDIVIDPQAEDGLILEEAAVMQQSIQIPQFKIKARLPPLGSAGNASSPDGPRPRPPPLVIPTLTIQTPSPTHQKTPPHLLGSPPPHRSVCQQDTCFPFASGKQARKMLKEFDKPTSLDLPSEPPMITITCNMSEAESDIESISPAPKASDHLGTSSSGMCYLSPFTIGSRGDRTASESNLSSSGYSSMASPGPSRCGSSNPLCPSEMEDPGPPGSGSTNLHPGLGRRPSPLLKSTPGTTECSKMENSDNQQGRGRSDSETLSDDPLVESNDEGIGTDHLDEKIEEGELKSAKELEVFITTECDSTKTLLDLPSITSLSPRVGKCASLEANIDRLMPPPSGTCKSTLQLPSIVVQNDPSTCDKHLSPMSSRSESPLSDKTVGLDRFSTQFYGRNKDILPFTDSDGLYDFPSSDKVNIAATIQQHRKSTGRRREKKATRQLKGSSPTKVLAPSLPLYHLDVPGKEVLHKIGSPRKPSPKRRARTKQLFSSSSSSDSITSGKEVRYSSSTPSPDTIRWSSSTDWLNGKEHRSLEASGEETGDETEIVLHPKSLEELPKPHPKISRLRVISNQIRFLRRLELSLKRKERVISPAESLESGEDSPRATSPLLQPVKEPRPEIRKSSSIGKLHANFSQPSVKNKRGRYKRGELLIPQDESSWKRVVITGNGYSD